MAKYIIAMIRDPHPDAYVFSKIPKKMECQMCGCYDFSEYENVELEQWEYECNKCGTLILNRYQKDKIE